MVFRTTLRRFLKLTSLQNNQTLPVISASAHKFLLDAANRVALHTGKLTCSSSPVVKNKSSTTQGSYEMVHLDPSGRTLTLVWKDGAQSRFHSIWLRQNCQCNHCHQEHSGQRLLNPSSVPHQISIENVCINGKDLEIHWGGKEGHIGFVPLSFLQANCYASKSLSLRREAAKLGLPLTFIPELHYDDLERTKDGVLRWLHQINESGISLLKEVPTEDQMVIKVAEHISPVQDLIYGKSFDVISTPKPINVAYSTVALDFHMDLIYYESPPGLQFLHCLRFDQCVKGGESKFLDVFHMAELFRLQEPDKFDTLCRIPATFQKIHYARDFPVEMKYQKPHIVLNHYKEIVAVNWAPPFEGPLAVEENDVEPYYEAYEAFAKVINSSPYIVEYRLHPGDLVTFNNRRILHARNSFDLNGGVRHLKGCYVNIDHFKSQVQVLSRLHGLTEPVKRVGNQDWF